jgi:preprotein translocase subunit SecD
LGEEGGLERHLHKVRKLERQAKQHTFRIINIQRSWHGLSQEKEKSKCSEKKYMYLNVDEDEGKAVHYKYFHFYQRKKQCKVHQVQPSDGDQAVLELNRRDIHSFLSIILQTNEISVIRKNIKRANHSQDKQGRVRNNFSNKIFILKTMSD